MAMLIEEEDFIYPIKLMGLRLAGKRIVCVGGGRVAARRISSLATLGCVIHVVSPSIHAQLAKMAADGPITWSQKCFDLSDLESLPFLVIAATNDSILNEEIASWCQEREILCNRTDDSYGSTAVFPVATNHEPSATTIGILSGGAGPVFSRWFLKRIITDLDHSGLANLAKWLRNHRLDNKGRSDNIASIHETILNSDVVTLLEQGRIEDARQLFDKMIDSA